MKRIAIFCDGTWNTPDKEEKGKLCQTNVVKMANAMSSKSGDGACQKLYYDSGVGSEGGWFKRVFDGATGTGISKNIMQAYGFLVRHYDPGDELFFFGFSRGAFTVRSLAGLIRNSGILDLKYIDKIEQAYDLYKARGEKFHPRSEAAVLFRKTYAVEEITRIRFIGVWDTVGALGNPLMFNKIVSRRNEFHDPELSSTIDFAYHALAIDEKRKNFQASLWHQQKKSVGQTLEQVWFAGVHSDIGGGYANATVSDTALQWLLEKAEGCKLKFEPFALKPADPHAQLHESRTGLYKIIPVYSRPIGAVPGSGLATNESLHPSVTERYSKESTYRPENLVKYLENPKRQ